MTDLELHASYVKGDLGAVTTLINRFQKPGFIPEAQDIALLIRHSERLRKSLSKFEQALSTKPARAASAKGGEVKGTK